MVTCNLTICFGRIDICQQFSDFQQFIHICIFCPAACISYFFHQRACSQNKSTQTNKIRIYSIDNLCSFNGIVIRKFFTANTGHKVDGQFNPRFSYLSAANDLFFLCTAFFNQSQNLIRTGFITGMDSVQTCFFQHFIIFCTDFCQCICPAIGCNTFDFRQFYTNVANDLCQPVRAQTHCICILQEDRIAVTFCQPAEYHMVAPSLVICCQSLIIFVDGFDIPVTISSFILFDTISQFCHCINVFFNIFHRACMEIIFFI